MSKLKQESVAFVESLYEVLRPQYSPTVIYEVRKRDNYVEVSFLNGQSRIPDPDGFEITVFDILVASLFLEEMNVLFEGITGTGKTFVTDLFFQAVFGEVGFHVERTNYNLFVESSVLKPFITTKLENNIPTQLINHDRTRSLGAIFVEEVNRRELNDLLALLDKKLVLAGDQAELGVPYPKSKDLKKIIVVSSQNPRDAAHSQVRENDIAEDNRFLKIPFPNAVDEAGSGQYMFSRRDPKRHDQLWEHYLGKIEGSGNRLELFADATDMRTFHFELNPVMREFVDLMLSYISKDPTVEVERNNQLVQSCGIELDVPIRDDDFLAKVLEVHAALKYPIVRRDVNKIMNFAKLIAFVRSIKQKEFSPAISLVDLVSSFGVLLEGRKVEIADVSMFDFVNDALQSYERLRDNYKTKPNQSARELILEKAINNFVNTGKKIEIFRSTLEDLASKNASMPFALPAMSVFNSRVVADVVVLSQCSRAYEDDFLSALNSATPRTALGKFYSSKLAEFSSIFVHRLNWLVEEFKA